MNKMQSILTGCLLLAGCLASAGCGSQDNPAKAASETETAPVTETVPATDQAVTTETTAPETETESAAMPDDADLVTDAYADSIAVESGGISELFCYHIPEIHLNGSLEAAVNARIYEEMKGILDDEVYSYDLEEGLYPLLAGMHYTWGRTSDALSVVVQTSLDYSWWGYYVYNISLDSGEMLSDQELLGLYGISEDEFHNQVRLELEAYIDSMFTPDQIGEEVYQMIVQQTVAEENISGVRPYINPDGKLGYVANIYSPAGADSYYHLMNYDDGTEADRIECQADHSEDAESDQPEEQETAAAAAVPLESLTGTWEIDAEYTMEYNDTGMTTIFGTAYKYGNQLNINGDGTLDYYVGVGYGGQGTYDFTDNVLHAEVTQYESDALESLELVPVSDEADEGLVRLKTYIAGYDIFWKKQ